MKEFKQDHLREAVIGLNELENNDFKVHIYGINLPQILCGFSIHPYSRFAL